MVIENGMTTFTTTATNNSNEDKMVDEFTIYVYDKENNQIATLVGYIGGILRKGETKDIINFTDIDLSNADKIEYKIKE